MKIILADQQVIFRTGAARILALEKDCDVIAQSANESALRSALQQFPGAAVVFSANLTADLPSLLEAIRTAGSHPILIVENGDTVTPELESLLDGLLRRSVTAATLVDCVRRVAAGTRCLHHLVEIPAATVDLAEETLLRRITPKEFQIIALVGEGCKNRDIADQLGTKEQVIKNYLRSIYEKTGVSDRLELALYTVHHKGLARVLGEVRATLERDHARRA